MMRPWIAFALVVLLGAAPPPLATLRIQTIATDDATPILYAQRSGMFAKAGLDVQLDRAGSGAAIAAAVLAGSYDVGLSNLVTLMSAHVRGVGFTLLAPAGIYRSKAPFSELVVARDSTAATGKDLDGKTIATPALDSLSTLVISNWVDAHGGDSRTLKFVEIPISAAQAAIELHRIDAALMNDTALSTALASGTVRILAPAMDAIAPEFPYSGWFTTTEWAAKHRDLVQAFARVMAESTAYTNAHHAETAAMLADFTGQTLDAVQHSNRADTGTVLRLSEIQPLIDLAAKYKFIAHAFPARELVDPSVARP
ncbi:MAG: ABC transporter substrate-binding protein [Candidatus Lustribacter sp.]|jgi:NitT/TauT family transport system substrate-binding protein